jgi:hypothetical protein
MQRGRSIFVFDFLVQGLQEFEFELSERVLQPFPRGLIIVTRAGGKYNDLRSVRLPRFWFSATLR